MAAIMLVGIVAYTQLPVSALPEVDYPTIQVLTFYPGASPDVVATTVTAPLERQFGEMQGLSQMTSTSSGATSVVVLQFNLSLNIDIAEEEVQSAINAAQSFLPANLPAPPIYSKTNPADAPVLTLGITSKTLPLSQVEDLVDTRLAPKISQLNGVGLVSISGGQKPAVRIQVNPAQLQSYGIDMEAVRTALVAASVNQAKGNFDGPRQDYQIDANDQLVTSADYKDVVVAYRNNAPVFLHDVANVVNGVENSKQAAWMNQTPAVILNVQRQPGANTISVVKSIQLLMPQLQANLPSGIAITTLTDLTTDIKASVADVEFELMLTIALVVMVIFLFLRNLYATIIPSVAVPLSIVGTFAAMYGLGYSLDNLSLMALTISTGFVVDDAIVMIENISRYLEEGHTPMQAALEGRGANRLHHRFTYRLADRRAHPAAVHGRCGRPPVPRVRRHPGRHHHHLRGGLADPDPDDVLPYPAPQSGGEAGPLLPGVGTCLRGDDCVLRPHPAGGSAIPGDHSAGGAGHAGAHHLPLHRHPQGLLPHPGYGRDPGNLPGARFHLLPGHGQRAAGTGQVILQDPGSRKPLLLHRRRRHQYHSQQRPHVHQSQAAEPA